MLVVPSGVALGGQPHLLESNGNTEAPTARVTTPADNYR